MLHATLTTLALLLSQSDTHVQHGLRVPKGFEIVEFADSKLANDIYCITVDPKGRIIVAGRGYIRILVDDDGDGRADRAIDFADGPKDGAMGLLWEGKSLYVTGDGGLRRYRDENSDDKADGPSELIRAMKTGGEHAAHAIQRGPDGWLYVLGGDGAGFDKSFATLPTSPIKEPIGGCVVRFSPDFKNSEIVAHGFRNAYAMDFNTDGELFTYDSDNERCVSLPWYEPTRFYHVIPGGHHGWLASQRATFFRLPPYFSDVIAPVATLGRGSPTGCVCYRQTQFPPRYRGGFFLSDWTFGRVHFVPLERTNSGYVGKPETFIQSVGDNGFAPTATVVHPITGHLYIAIGGRGTRGAVYRASHPATANPPEGAKANPGRPVGIKARNRFDLNRFREELARDPHDRVSETIYLVQKADDERLRLAGIRGLQICLGDVGSARMKGTVWEGYSAAGPALVIAELQRALSETCREVFPTGRRLIDHELARTLALVEDQDPRSLSKVAHAVAKTADPVDQLHYLIVLARLRAARTDAITKIAADSLISLDRRIVELRLHRDRNWPLRVAELHAELAKQDPDLNAVFLAHAEFGRPDHVLFTRCPGFDKQRAAEIFLKKSEAAREFAWSPELVALMGSLPDEQVQPVIRRLWDQLGLQEAILEVLAKKPDVIDRAKFLQGLASPQLATIRRCLDALQRMPPAEKDTELLTLVLAMRRLGESKEETALRERLAGELRRASGEKHAAERQLWTDWLTRQYPKLAPRLEGPDGVDRVAWQKRLAGVNWDRGNVEAGRRVYDRVGCASCHAGSQTLGPDLRGIAQRFSRDDLFTAILQPSKDVSPRYQTLLVATDKGQTYQGSVIYEAVDSLILQTGPTTTVRVPAELITARRASATSLMPAGLLDKVNDAEIADLYTYLRQHK